MMLSSRPRRLDGGVLIAFLITCSLAVGGCHRRPTPYRTAMLEAESARRNGDFEAERERFHQAALLAKKQEDAQEANYRRAESFAREGRYETGAQELQAFAERFPDSPRAARAWLSAGRNWERAKRPEKALLAFGKVVARYGDSGGAISAAARIVVLETELHGSLAHEEWRKLLERNQASELDEGLRYRYAQALEEISAKNAILAYEDVAKKHPLPRGSHADEALLRAAELRIQLNDPEGAIDTLDLLIGQGGPAAIVGSYTRTAYVEAMLLKGKVLRDDVARPHEALETFRSLADKYPTSRLVDDALWEGVRTERRLGQAGCSLMRKLVESRPESRFAPCENVVCGDDETDERMEAQCLRWLEIPAKER